MRFALYFAAVLVVLASPLVACNGHGAIMPDGSVVAIVGNNIPAGGREVNSLQFEKLLSQQQQRQEEEQNAQPFLPPSSPVAQAQAVIPPEPSVNAILPPPDTGSPRTEKKDIDYNG